MDKITCLVTIHGIGFQHAPKDGNGGYADGLHAALSQRIGGLLSGDPVAEFGRTAGTGAVYVHSDWPPGSGKITEGLSRLGRWQAGDASHREVDSDKVPLTDETHKIAHVALVYAGLEEQQPHLGASVETLAKAAMSAHNYASLPSLVHTGLADAWAILHHAHAANGAPSSSLQVRQAVTATSTQVVAATDRSGPLSVIGQLDQDVTTYVCRNDLRERVRSFVHDALLLIACRKDVATVVVNSHSQGTVLVFDVVREMPPFASAKIKHLITAGSPLRKYADLFYWGTDAACISSIPWTNFWDETDPVADPLEPPRTWRRGDPIPPSTGTSQLYESTDPDTGDPLPVSLSDVLVSNADHGAGGGLAAHNYWDNNPQFVVPLAGILSEVGGGP
jgi:hypothetical protein